MAGDIEQQRDGGILSGVSVASVLATALAAVTSFALQSRIGFAGSVVGTALAAAASTVVTRIYENMLISSAQRLRSATPPGRQTDGAQPGAAARGPAAGSSSGRKGAKAIRHRLRETAAARSRATEHMRQVAAARHARDLQARVILFAATAAVSLALVIAGVIVLTTQGEGIRISAASQTPAAVTTVTGEDPGNAHDPADGGDGAREGDGAAADGAGEVGESVPPDGSAGQGGASPDPDAGAGDTPSSGAPADPAPTPDDATGGTGTTDPGESSGPSTETAPGEP